MNKFNEYLASQCGNPRGPIGRIMTWGMNRTNNIMYKGLLKHILKNPPSELLDIGFGNGHFIKLVSKRINCSIRGIDISEDMVKLASQKNKQGISHGNIKLTTGDCCNLEFYDYSFDAITTMNTIYFWEDTTLGMKEIYRVLKDNGIFYNAVFTKDRMDSVFFTKDGFKKFEKNEYEELGRQAGFRKVSFQSLGKNYGMLVIYEK